MASCVDFQDPWDIFTENVHLFKEFIQTIDARIIIIQLCNDLGEIFTKEKKSQILAIARRKGNTAAMNVILDEILEAEDTPDVTNERKLKAFCTCLDETEYGYYRQLLTNEAKVDRHQTQNQERIISVFAKPIAETVQPTTILPNLLAKKLITLPDSQEIQAVDNNFGSIQACHVLLGKIFPPKKETWFDDFLHVLMEAKHCELVHMLDDEFIQKKREQGLYHDVDFKPYSDSFTSETPKDASNGTNETLDTSVKENIMCMEVFPTADDETQNNFSLDMSDIFRDFNESEEKENKSDDTEKKTKYKNFSSNAMTMNATDSGYNMSGISRSLAIGGNKTINNTDDYALTSMNEALDEAFGLKDSVINAKSSDERSVIENSRQPGGDPYDQPIKEIELRSYQKELAESGLKGENCVIVAPTGSGKTHVALYIIKAHFHAKKRLRIPKVVFLTEQSELAEQQGKLCKEYIDANIKVITGETQRVENHQELKEWVDNRDVLVVTAQLLVNALNAGDVRIEQFSLMVFDECHHTNLKHAFNRIMHYYLDLKFKLEKDKKDVKGVLPQIVGLTASLGVGKAKNKNEAISWIEKIMSHLDATELCTVENNKVELMQHSSIPEQTIEKAAARRKNTFGKLLQKAMEKIEEMMKKSEYAEDLCSRSEILKPPAQKHSEAYTQWLSNLWRQTAQISDQKCRRFFSTCRIYLEIYHKGLCIYEDARVEDALNYLKEEVENINTDAKPEKTDEQMLSVFKKLSGFLEKCANDPDESNPKLEKLKELLLVAYEENEDSRGIIFVKTRDLVKAITEWMNHDPNLKGLNAVRFVGAQASNDKGGSTKKEQMNVLQLFKNGKHKVIVATSVAEEGLDIQKCNLVIRYDHVTNEIAMVQSRGRGRAEDSQYVVLTGCSSRAGAKEELNIMRVAMMHEAIKRLRDAIKKNKEGFLRKIKDIQIEENIARVLEARKKGARALEDGQFELRCQHCNQFISMSTDIRTIKSAHHTTLVENLAEHVQAKKNNQPSFTDRDIQASVARLLCRECGDTIGNITLYKNVQFPILKIEKLLIVDAYGNKLVKKRWKQVPFLIQEISSDDLLRMIDKDEKFVDEL